MRILLATLALLVGGCSAGMRRDFALRPQWVEERIFNPETGEVETRRELLVPAFYRWRREN